MDLSSLWGHERGVRKRVNGRLYILGEYSGDHEQIRKLLILEQAVENTNEAFITIDQDHKVLFFNKAAEKIFGYSREEVLGHDLDVIMSPGCATSHHQAVRRYVETKIPKKIGHESELVASRKNGETFPASISFSVTQLNGRYFFTGIVRDLTETKELQDKLLQSERLAALGQLVAEITHEIKNPLMTIGGFAKQLLKKCDNEKDLHKLNIIVEEVKRMEGLIGDLTEYYLPRPLETEPVDLNDLFQEINSMLKPEAKKRKIQIGFVSHADPLVVIGDRRRLKQVFLNLLRNAVDAVEMGGKISVTAKKIKEHVEIVVNDNGCGIPEEYLDKIFVPFFTTKKHGTGLGLSISKRIIEEHPGGSLTVESTPEKGTSFKMLLPLHAPHQ